MSGHKKATITISQKEYQRLHKNELRMRFMQKPDESHLVASRSEAQSAYQADLQELEFRQRDFEKLIADFENHLRNLESEASCALLEQQAAVSESVVQAVDLSWNDTRQVLQNQEERLTALVENYSDDIQNRLAELDQLVHTEKMSLTQRHEKVARMVEQAYQMAEFIERHYDHEKFVPGEVEGHYHSLSMAEENLKNGFAETALGASQQAYLALSALRARLESEQHQFEVLFEVVSQKLEKIHLMAWANRALPGLDLDGNEIEDTVDTDYWSSRKLSRFLNEIQGAARNLDTNRPTMRVEDLTTFLENEIPRMEQELGEIVYTARLNALNSQLRVNIADMVVQALTTQGYSMEEADYENRDMRQEYRVKVHDPEGNQVLVQVIPNPGCENELQLHTLDNSARTQHELRQQTREISNALHHFGLSMGPVTETENWNPETFRRSRVPSRRIKSPGEESAWKHTQRLS